MQDRRCAQYSSQSHVVCQRREQRRVRCTWGAKQAICVDEADGAVCEEYNNTLRCAVRCRIGRHPIRVRDRLRHWLRLGGPPVIATVHRPPTVDPPSTVHRPPSLFVLIKPGGSQSPRLPAAVVPPRLAIAGKSNCLTSPNSLGISITALVVPTWHDIYMTYSK